MGETAHTENKSYWCEQGHQDEAAFLDIAHQYGLDLVWHPSKETNVYETDFQLANGLIDIDLKHVTTPFFKAGDYGYDPDHAVTFNHKDYIRYRYKYPEWGNDMVILFWVEWESQKRFGIDVRAISGVWSLRLSVFDELLRQGKLSCHTYLNRKTDNGTNAKHSWLVDLRACKRHKNG